MAFTKSNVAADKNLAVPNTKGKNEMLGSSLRLSFPVTSMQFDILTVV